MTYTNLPAAERITPPASEPVTLAEVKDYLRITGSGEDTHLTRLIQIARESAEQYLARSLITQTWKLSVHDFVPSSFPLPYGPVQSITSVKVIARDNSETTIAAANYYLAVNKDRLILDTPLLGHIIAVTYVAGYGSATVVPAPIKQAMLTHLAEMYENRRENADLPAHSRALYSPYRSFRI